MTIDQVLGWQTHHIADTAFKLKESSQTVDREADSASKKIDTSQDFFDSEAVLGPHEPFNIEAHRAATGTESTTLDAIAAVAGWHGNWDRMIEVSEHATTEKLVTWAGPASVCWEGLTNDVVWAEGTSEGVYLFMDGGNPVQTVHFTGPDKLIFIGKRPPVVLRHDVLTPNGKYLLSPE
ncbi:hypothetical protein [Nocardia carnea]|uniref:hypothetical protein n=1 Tax=Nocardia carnea TaxID=37328 RepID=UPI0005275EC9|nr:hypothetical protein [Nocardia carnea]